MLYEGNEVRGKLAMKISTNRARNLSDLGNCSDMYRMYGSRSMQDAIVEGKSF